MSIIQNISEIYAIINNEIMKKTYLADAGKGGSLWTTTCDNSVNPPIIETQHIFALIITQTFYVLIKEKLYILALCHNHTDIELI